MVNSVRFVIYKEENLASGLEMRLQALGASCDKSFITVKKGWRKPLWWHVHQKGQRVPHSLVWAGLDTLCQLVTNNRKVLPDPHPQFSSVQLLSHVWLFATPWTATHQASLSITNSRSSPKLMSIESVMPSNHLILCRPLLLLPSIFPSIRVF